MNLRNGQITIGEILSNPKARALFQREFPAYANHPMLRLMGGMTLGQVYHIAVGKMGKQRADQMMEQLKRL